MAAITNTSPFQSSLTLQVMSHMITVKLSSSNYLLWHSFIHPLFFSQKFLPYVNGSLPSPSKTVVDSAGSTSLNSMYVKWYANDQIVKVFLTSTLSEETLATVIGCATSRDILDTLASVFNCQSKSREFKIKDELQLMTKGSLSVTEFGSKFKGLCDQLAAMGRTVDDADKSHWFLCRLGSVTFLSLAESHEIFIKAVQHGSSSAGNAAFAAQHGHAGSGRGGGQHGRPSSGQGGGQPGGLSSSQGRGSHSNGGGHGRGRSNPTCQICRVRGHYATFSPERYGDSSTQ